MTKMPDKNDRGKITLFAKGRIGVLKGGVIAVLNKDGECTTCCGGDCEPYIMARKTTNSANQIWDLTPYQGRGKAKKNTTHWRIIESSYRLNYGSGTVDDERELVDLPNQFRSSYSYNGYMELQIGCEDENGNIEWPSL
jgi:hypothetical protein